MFWEESSSFEVEKVVKLAQCKEFIRYKIDVFICKMYEMLIWRRLLCIELGNCQPKISIFLHQTWREQIQSIEWVGWLNSVDVIIHLF